MRENKLLNKLERKFGNFGLPNLMNLIVFGMAVVFMLDTFINPDYEVSFWSLIYFNRDAVFSGQVWRIITFVFEPPSTSLLFVVFALYFYWLIGNTLERQWGTFRFNVYYFTGMLGSIIGGLITGYATNAYIHLTMFLAFAILYSNFQVLVFFVIPVKMKWLAWLDAILLVFSLIFNDWPGRIAILISIANFLLFFGLDLWDATKRFFRRIFNKKKKNALNNNQNQGKRYDHWWDDQNNNPFK